MSWTAQLRGIAPEGGGSQNVTALVVYVNDQTGEERSRVYSLRDFYMKAIQALAVQGVAELDRIDAIMASNQEISDALAAGNQIEMAKSLPEITVADASPVPVG